MSFTSADFSTVQVTIWAKYYEFSSFVFLVYDILLTLTSEVQVIWKRRFSILTVLWIINRWVIFILVLPNVIFFQVPSLSKISVCKHFFRYPSYIQIFQRIVAGAIFTIRTYCIYGRRLGPAILLVVLFAFEFSVKLKWALPLQDPWGFIGCALEPGRPHVFVVYFVPELLADAVVLGLALWRARQLKVRMSDDKAWLWKELIRGNALYFFAMFICNIATILMQLLAPPTFKEANAYYGLMLNIVLTSRLILNLRQADPSKRPVYSTNHGARWKMGAINKMVDDFDDSPQLTETYIMDTVRRIKARS